MMVMTAKIDKKKIALALAALAALVAVLILLFGGGDTETAVTETWSPVSNDGRVKLLQDYGWSVAATPVESNQVRIPTESNEVFDRYNALQKNQGFDLTAYAGKTLMRYVYKVNNFPGATEPVYATLLVYRNKLVGGDITDTAAGGGVQGLQSSGSSNATMPSASDASEGSTAPAEPAEP